MLREGDLAPRFARRPVSGPTVDTARLGAEGRLVLAFLRHPGSPFARAALAGLEAVHPELDRAGIPLVVVMRGSEAALRDLVPRRRLLFPVVPDPEGVLFQAWDLADSGLLASLRDPAPLRLLRALRHGQGRIDGPPGQVQAAFVVEKGGRIHWAWRGRSITEWPDAEILKVAALG